MDWSTNVTLNDLQKLRILGEGTYGKCYLVQNKIINELCVLKQIEIFGMSPQQQEQVIKQARILSLLDHPSIVKFYTFFKTDSYLNIVMEYADGGDLNKMIRDAKGNHFPQPQILNWFTQICLAIKHIHDRKIIHRDLKCQNIFMTKQGHIKLGDFGIAKHLSKTLQKIKTVVGTPYYMSPQICQNKDYSLKTDIWSLGVILYEMCAMKLPFDGSSLPVLALKISRGEYPAITANYSKQLKTLIKNLLQNNPAKRPSINKILENSLISKKISAHLPKHILIRQFSLNNININITNKIVIQKQKQSAKQKQKQLELQMMQDNSDIVHSARCNTNNVSKKNSQIRSKNSEIIGHKYSGVNINYNPSVNSPNLASNPNSKSTKQKKKKSQPTTFKRRQISEPNLGTKKYQQMKNNYVNSLITNNNYQNLDLVVKQEEEQIYENSSSELEEKEKQNKNVQMSSSIIPETLEETLKKIIRDRNQDSISTKYLETCDGLGFAPESFSGNGVVSLLWAIQNFHFGVGAVSNNIKI